MDKYEQIGKLAEAADLIREVLNVCPPGFEVALEQIVDDIADIADEIERAE